LVKALQISATSSSKFSVQFVVDGGDIALNGNRVTVGTTAGKAKIKAFQIGNSQFNSISLSQSFCVIPATPKITSSGGNLVVSGGKNFQWYLVGNPIGGQTTATSLKPDRNCVYTVKAVTDDGCVSAASNGIENKIPVLGTELDENIKVVIYPNPTADELRIDLPAGIMFKEANFYSISGSNVINYDKLSGSNTLNISQLPKGLYSIKIQTSHGSAVKKIVRE